jgi:hypothetical protein
MHLGIYRMSVDMIPRLSSFLLSIRFGGIP